MAANPNPYIVANEEATEAASAAPPTPRLVRGSEEFRQAEQRDFALVSIRAACEELAEAYDLIESDTTVAEILAIATEGGWRPQKLVRSPEVNIQREHGKRQAGPTVMPGDAT